MSGPSVSRSNVNTAPLPGLTNPYQALLGQLLGFSQGPGGQATPQQQQGMQGLNNLPPWMRNVGGVQQQLQQQVGQNQGQLTFDPTNPGAQQLLQNLFLNQQPSMLQQQVMQRYGNQLNQPTAQQNAYQTAQGGIQQLLGTQNQYYGDILNQASGQGIVNAAQPIFQRNLQLGADTLRQAGPRFASNTERLVQEQGQRGIQDFNLFSQQAMESGRNQQLAALAGLTQGQLGSFGMLGNLAGGADQSIANLLGGAGGFGNQLFQLLTQQGGMNQNMLAQLLGLGGQYGTGPAALVQNPGGFANFTDFLGTAGGLAIGGGWRPFGKGNSR